MQPNKEKRSFVSYPEVGRISIDFYELFADFQVALSGIFVRWVHIFQIHNKFLRQSLEYLITWLINPVYLENSHELNDIAKGLVSLQDFVSIMQILLITNGVKWFWAMIIKLNVLHQYLHNWSINKYGMSTCVCLPNKFHICGPIPFKVGTVTGVGQSQIMANDIVGCHGYIKHKWRTAVEVIWLTAD